MPEYQVSFKPRADLYAKGNDATLLLRDLARIGELSVHCDMDALPGLDELDAEGAYLAWTISIKTDKGEEAIRTVFEFAEWDCELEVQRIEDAAASKGDDELPMVPVPFDLSALDDDGGGQTAEEGSQLADDVAAAVAAAETVSNIAQLAAARVERRKLRPLPPLPVSPRRTMPPLPASARPSASISTVSIA